MTYRLEGITEDSSMIYILHNSQLKLVPLIADDTPVVEGQPLGLVDVDPSIRDHLDRNGEQGSNLDKSRLAQLEALGGEATSPVNGVFTMRDGTPTVLTDGVDVVVDLTPIQHLRYRSFRFTGEAVVESVIGIRQVSCAAVWTETVDQGDGSTAAQLRCRLPRQVETVSGLRARVVLTTELMSDVVVVLNTYVGYDATDDGYFLLVREDDHERRLPVIVGATDGVRRVILSEVPVGSELIRPLDGDGTGE